MQRDNQGRALLRLPTTMRVAFAEALAQTNGRTPLRGSIQSALKNPRTGYRKVPAWTVTRRAKR